MSSPHGKMRTLIARRSLSRQVGFSTMKMRTNRNMSTIPQRMKTKTKSTRYKGSS